jgi:hypothetical protein
MSLTSTADGISLPSASAPVDKRTSVSVTPGNYDYSSGLIARERVLTFNDAGLRQGSLSGRRLGICLRGGSGLLSRRRGFFFRHLCSGFIPLPRQVRRFPVEYTSRLSIKYDYHIQVLLGKEASPASKETSSSTHKLETSVLDYLLQDGLPLEMWSP